MLMSRIAWPLLPLLFLISAPALAWNKPGHMVTGAIAHDVLRENHPDVLAAVLALLRHHPEYDDILAKRLEAVPVESRDRYLFMIAARWADDVRNRTEYHRAAWHFINHPIVAAADREQIRPPEPAADNLVTALKSNMNQLKADGDDGAKAVALCWVFHLIGDAHQPLHACSFFGDRWPQGDRGGNSFYVRVKAGGAVLNLHSLWDGLIIGSQNYRSVSNESTRLRKRPDFERGKLGELANSDIEQWVKESFDAAATTAYVNGTLRGGNDRHDGPVLPAGYTNTAKAVAERRIVLAGYRLAGTLTALYGK